MSASDVFQMLAFGHQLADAADKAILPLFRSSLDIDNKKETGFDPVTEADRSCEQAMRALIARTFPDHGIMGEEFASQASSHPDALTWVLDPIDGTRAFICGMPTWMTLIGLLDREGMVCGVASQAYTGERFYAGNGASWHRDRVGSKTRLKARPHTCLEEAIFCSTVPDLFTGTLKAPFKTLKSRARLTYIGGDAYTFCLLAAGCIDLVIDPAMQAHDIAALVPIIEQAGGIVTTLDGGPAHNGGDIIAAANARLHKQVCELFAAGGSA